MRVSVDERLCGGHGECLVVAPELFGFPDDGPVVTVLRPDPPAELRPAALEARDRCPNAAITVTG